LESETGLEKRVELTFYLLESFLKIRVRLLIFFPALSRKTICFRVPFEPRGRFATKAQILSHFAKNFELSKRTASGILGRVATLALSETGKIGSFNPCRDRKIGPGQKGGSYGRQSGYRWGD
jgi:hypothetical protein